MPSTAPARAPRLGLLGPAITTALASAILLDAFGVPEVLTAASKTGDDTAPIVHVLNRITFGPRPGDVTRVRALGIKAYIEQQLHPEQVDDSRLERKLSGFETLELTTATIVSEYHLPALMARRRLREETARSRSVVGNWFSRN